MSSGMAWRGAGLRGAFDLDGLAAEELLFGLGGVAVDADLAGFDEELDAGAGDVGDGLGEVLVEAEVGGGGVGGEGADVVRLRNLRRLRGRGRGWGAGRGLFDAAGGAVLGTDGAAALALGEHVLRRHGGPAFGGWVKGGGR